MGASLLTSTRRRLGFLKVLLVLRWPLPHSFRAPRSTFIVHSLLASLTTDYKSRLKFTLLLFVGRLKTLFLSVLDVHVSAMIICVKNSSTPYCLLLDYGWRHDLSFVSPYEVHRQVDVSWLCLISRPGCPICIGNSMICSDIWHKYHEWYFKIVIRNFTSR